MVPIIPLITAGVGLYSAWRSAQQQKEAEEAMKRQMKNRPTYAPSQSVKTLLNDTQGRINAVNPALIQSYQLAQQQAANQMGFAQRNATSGAEALAMASNAQAQVNAAIPKMAMMQADFQQNNLQAYYRALAAMSGEEQNVYQDQLARNSDMVNFQLGRMGAANANLGQGMGLAAAGLSAMGTGMYGNVYGQGQTNNGYRLPNFMTGPYSGIWG